MMPMPRGSILSASRVGSNLPVISFIFVHLKPSGINFNLECTKKELTVGDPLNGENVFVLLDEVDGKDKKTVEKNDRKGNVVPQSNKRSGNSALLFSR